MQKYYPIDFELEKASCKLREGTAVSNIDGRLWAEVGIDTGRFFGDEAFVRARIGVEARYLIALSEIGVIRKLTIKEVGFLLTLHKKITPQVFNSIRKVEAEVRHDVVAMTTIFKRLAKYQKSLNDVIDHGWLHWGLTSEDVDNLARSVLISNFLATTYLPKLKHVILEIAVAAHHYASITLPGKTHLQSAAPTTLGKELALFALRLAQNYQKIKTLKLSGKLTGAVGNLSAHKLAYPTIDWKKFSQNFVSSLKLEPNLYTTQIEPRRKFIELLQTLENVNSILIDFSQDMRIYCGLGWLTQLINKKEFGSSAMPQKVNPIDFENAQGNALFSNWILEGLVRQLPVSWLQRDLVDKTIYRNVGLPFGHSFISLVSTDKGVSRVKPNNTKIKDDLESDWGILAEAYQIRLRAHGIGNAYNDLKNLSRGEIVTHEVVVAWIESLKIDEKIKKELLQINFNAYTGYALKNCLEMIKLVNSLTK